MKYSEAIIGSLKKLKIGHGEIYPISFQQFTRNLAALQLLLSSNLFLTDYPDVSMGSEHYLGAAVENPKLSDAIALISGSTFPSLRDVTLTQTWTAFISWLLDQPTPEDDDEEDMWYDVDILAKKFNEFVNEYKEKST